MPSICDHMDMKTATQNSSNPNISRTAKDALARLMASENIRVQHSASARTAAFDVVNRVLILPVWEDMSHDLYDMLVTHEVGHALYTPADMQVTEAACDYIAGNSQQGQFIAKQFLNIIEDARIERMMKDKFPGSKRSFFRAYSELWDRDFFKMNGEDINAANLADRINLYFKGDIMGLASVSFNADEQVFVDRASTATTFEEVIEIAADLYEYMKLQDEQNQEDTGPQMDQGEGNDGDEGDTGFDAGDESDADGPSTAMGSGDESDEDGDEGNGHGDGAINADSDDTADTENGEGGESKGDGTMDGGESDDDGSTAEGQDVNSQEAGTGNEGTPQETTEGTIPQGSETERAFEDAVRDLTDENAQERHYFDVPTMELDNIVVDWTDIRDCFSCVRAQADFNGATLWNDFVRSNKSVVNNMAKQFEMKKSADADRRTMVGKSGKIDMTRVFSYQYNEDIFLRNEVTADGKNHGMVMFVDWSGSMSDCIGDTIEQVLCLALFCQKVNIPFEVYAFSSHWYDNREENTNRYSSRNEIRRMTKEQTAIIADEDCSWDSYKKGEIKGYDSGTYLDPRNFHLLNLISSRAKKNAFKELAENMMVMAQQMSYSADVRLDVPYNFGLGGTPLNEAILAACDIVPQFREKNNLQVVNTVFLTDGEASSMSGGWGHNVIQNSKRGITVDSDRGRRNGMTEALLNYFRLATGGRCIGMFLASAKTKRQFEGVARGFFTHEELYSDYTTIDTKWADWKKEHFFAAAMGGYDEYFVIDAGTKTTNVDLNDLDDDASFTKIRNTFAKATTGRNMSRVLMNRFTDLVATNLS